MPPLARIPRIGMRAPTVVSATFRRTANGARDGSACPRLHRSTLLRGALPHDAEVSGMTPHFHDADESIRSVRIAHVQ